MYISLYVWWTGETISACWLLTAEKNGGLHYYWCGADS